MWTYLRVRKSGMGVALRRDEVFSRMMSFWLLSSSTFLGKRMSMFLYLHCNVACSDENPGFFLLISGPRSHLTSLRHDLFFLPILCWWMCSSEA